MVFNLLLLSLLNNTFSLPYLLVPVLLGSMASEAAGHANLHPRPEHMKMRERETTRVPHLLHQSWKSHNLSSNFERWQASWRLNHPHWEYKCAAQLLFFRALSRDVLQAPRHVALAGSGTTKATVSWCLNTTHGRPTRLCLCWLRH